MANALALATGHRRFGSIPAWTGYVSGSERPPGYWTGSFTKITTLVSNLGRRRCLLPEGSGWKTTVFVDNRVSAESDSAFWHRFDFGLAAVLPSAFAVPDFMTMSVLGYSGFEVSDLKSTGSTSGILLGSCWSLFSESADSGIDFAIDATAYALKVADEPFYSTHDFSGSLLFSHPAAFPNRVAETPADLLTRIRAHLSLNTTELARTVGVERASIYGWMKGKYPPRPENHRRLIILARLAHTWTELCHEPIGDLKHALLEGNSTLIDLLSIPELDEPKIKEALVILAERWKIDVKSKAAKRGKSIHEIAGERGWEPVDPEIREQSIRRLSLSSGE